MCEGMEDQDGKEMKENDKIFTTIGETDEGFVETESLCMACYKQGTTKLLLIDVPYFRRVIVSSFYCSHCGNKNESIQSAEPIKPKGIRIILKLESPEDLQRFLVREEPATISIPHLDFESVGFNGTSYVMALEGVLDEFVRGMKQAKERYKEVNPSLSEQLGEFSTKISNLMENFEPFMMVIDDPSGNSFLENIHAPGSDPNVTIKHYFRTLDQNRKLGLVADDAIDGFPNAYHETEVDYEENEDIQRMKAHCMNCSAMIDFVVHKISIPYFKEVILLSNVCDNCGFKTNEVKSAGAIEPHGVKTTLSIENIEDLSRDILKSEFCKITIPELDIELPAGTLGSSFAILETLIMSVRDQLQNLHPFSFGDSKNMKTKNRLDDLLEKFNLILEGKMKATIIMDDPTGNSHIQNVCVPKEDPQLKIEKYTRTYEQDDELGLNDMKTENY